MDQSQHLLICDDDREIRDLLQRFLRQHGYRVDTAANAAQASQMLDNGRFDLVVLDIMMPGEDGLALCRRLRATSSLPVILLTAIAEETDRIVGLEMGADDYVTKPFNPRELLARIRAVLRRATPTSTPVNDNYSFDGWTLDPAKRELRNPEGVIVPLSSGEYDLLIAFLERPQRVLNRDQLLDLTKGRAAIPFDRSVDVQLSRLRRKIEIDPKEPEIIKTVRGGGYVLVSAVERQ